MKFSKSLINFNVEDKPTDRAKKLDINNISQEDYKKLLEIQQAKKDAFDKEYKKICEKGKITGSNGMEHDYVDVAHKIKKAPRKVINVAGKLKDEYVRDAKELWHGVHGEIADKRDEKGNPISYKKRDLTFLKTDEDDLKEKMARDFGVRAPNNNAIIGTTGVRALEVGAPIGAAAFLLGRHFNKKRKRKKLYNALIEEGYSPNEAEKLSLDASEQVTNSKQTNFNAITKAGKWLLEYGLVAPFKGRKVTTAFNPVTGKVQPFKEGIRATKNVYNDKGILIAKPGEYVREGGMTGATTLGEKIGKGAFGAANVALTASLLTMPASVAADFKRNAEYTKKYTIDPNKHYVIEQDLADNKKVRLIGKTSGYLNRSDANIEAERHAGGGMYQVYAIKGSELARIMPRKFTLEYYENEY